MRVEACDIGGDFETRIAKIFVEFVVATVASPFENVIDALADERVEVLRVESILQLAFLNETLCVSRDHFARGQQSLDACAHVGVEKIRHEQRSEDAVLRFGDRTERRRDDRLALDPNAGHVVEVVRLHCKSTEITGNPAIFIGATDTDCAMTLAACLVELRCGNAEA